MPYVPSVDSLDVFPCRGDAVIVDIVQRFRLPLLTTLDSDEVMTPEDWDLIPFCPARWLLRLPRLMTVDEQQYGFCIASSEDFRPLFWSGCRVAAEIVFVKPATDMRQHRGWYDEVERPTYAGFVQLAPMVWELGFPWDDEPSRQFKARSYAFCSQH